MTPDPRRFTLSDVTKSMDAPYAAALKEKSVERALDRFAQGTIDALKALPVPPPRVAQKSDE